MSYDISLISGKRNICLKLSIANKGKSFWDFPKCWSGCANCAPSACKQLIFA